MGTTRGSACGAGGQAAASSLRLSALVGGAETLQWHAAQQVHRFHHQMVEQAQRAFGSFLSTGYNSSDELAWNGMRANWLFLEGVPSLIRLVSLQSAVRHPGTSSR